MKKYELTDETKTLLDGCVLHRIVALCDFANVKKGDKGILIGFFWLILRSVLKTSLNTL